MNVNRKRAVATIGSVLALSGIGSAMALGATGSTSTPSVTPSTQVTPTKDIAGKGDVVDKKVQDVATKGDKTDVVTDRETADRPGQEGVENQTAEAAGQRQVGEGTAADRGHQDPAGQVDQVDNVVK